MWEIRLLINYSVINWETFFRWFDGVCVDRRKTFIFSCPVVVLPGLNLQEDPTLILHHCYLHERNISRDAKSMRSMIIELREYRQFHELMAVTDCAASSMERRWDFLSRFLFTCASQQPVSDNRSGKVIVFSTIYSPPSSAGTARHVMWNR